MHIRQISPYALAAGALVVIVLLVGDGDGADAATEAVGGAVSDAVNEAAPAAQDTAGTVVVQPDPVAPGTAFSVHDGGSCGGESATATFGDAADIPAMQLPGQSGRTEGTAILPESTAPGSYTVTLTCGGTSGARPSALASGRDGDDEDHGAGYGTEQGDGDAGGRGKESGDGRKVLTGTMIVSGGADGTVPQGGADTGLGGAAGTGRTATTAGGLLLMAAAGWGALARRRGTRGTGS
ncbi:hypothetical protein HXP44_00855 [Streptomyces sioyaensis]|uniref:Uncharacterized protein n=1 Tax=Streptomyces sioyaensis TaxID=67364 RepID=A0A4Q1R8T6_9ACTN|nr:hypothetical protein [Streptomyces sioyaensis]MBM4790646.1 hypothetical protein [Streptomyces sioyaensis]RXS69814.1 hypothetical protein EST54_04615 [Streptomyces sioyaensis]